MVEDLGLVASEFRVQVGIWGPVGLVWGVFEVFRFGGLDFGASVQVVWVQGLASKGSGLGAKDYSILS